MAAASAEEIVSHEPQRVVQQEITNQSLPEHEEHKQSSPKNDPAPELQKPELKEHLLS